MLLVPADPLSPRQPDEHFADEAAAARAHGIAVALVDHDGMAEDAARAVSRVPQQQESIAVYRGWMLRSEHYGAMESALAARGVQLRTTAQDYRRAHELPGWVDQAGPVTARTVWTAGFERADFEDALARLDAREAVLRDYCKSLKHNWDEAMHIADAGDFGAAWTIAQRFVQLRDEDAVGGFVVREFEHFVGAEVRTWWVAGECVLTGPHPDIDGSVFSEPDLADISPVIRALRHPFVSVDLRLDVSGCWRLIEVGDGQVSDRPRSVDSAEFLAAIS